MNAFFLIIPFFLIRFGLLAMINRKALRRAAFFAPLEGVEKAAYLVYQAATVFLVLYPFFVKTGTGMPWFAIGLVIYITGVVVLAISTVQFAKPNADGLHSQGIYKVSRNPMYLGYFLYFLGCGLLMRSTLFVLALLLFQISAHWIILSEERWCIHTFGSDYVSYMQRVRRYF